MSLSPSGSLKMSLGWVTVNSAAGVPITQNVAAPVPTLPFVAIYIFPNRNNQGDGYFGTANMNPDPSSGTELEGVIPKPTSNGIFQPYTQSSGGRVVIGEAGQYILKADVLGDKFLVVIFLW